MKKGFRNLFFALILMLIIIPSAAASQTVSVEVEEKVDEIVAQCKAEGITGEYETALWLHDWLIYNADYDQTLTIHGPEGVLLQGTGVCESYALAYNLLLDEVGIENQILYADIMEHAWNLVKIDGEWCHVDCTWDDPVPGNAENHNYFGLNDELMKRDHIWEQRTYPVTTSLDNLYLIREGEDVVSNEEQLYAYLHAKAETQTRFFQVHYIGAAADFNIIELFQRWCEDYNWKYGLFLRSYGGSAYNLDVNQIDYSDPWIKPAPLEHPVQGEEFDLSGPNGRYQSSELSDQVILFIFSNSTCGNTARLLDRLTTQLDAMENAGVHVIVNLLDCPDEATLIDTAMYASYPDVAFTCADGYFMWDNLRLFGINSNVFLPVVFLYNSGMITYYSVGPLGEHATDDLIELTYAATGNKLVDHGKITGQNGAQLNWYLYEDGKLNLSGLPEDHQLCIAAYNDKNMLTGLSIVDNRTASVMLDQSKGTYRIFWLDAGFLPQSVATPIAF